MMDPRVFLLSVLGPLIGYNLTLKTARILSHVDPGLIDFFRLIGLDLAFALAYISLWLGLFALTRRGSGARKVLLVLLPAVSALFALTTTIAHQYFSVTGVALSYQVLAFSISGLDEVRPIIASEASFTSWFVVLAYFAMGPWLLSRVLVCSPDGTNPSHEVRDYRLTYLAGLTAVGFGLLSLIPRGEGVSRPFARDPFVNLLATAVGGWRHNEPVRARPRPATNARLDRTPLTTDRNVVLIILESTGANVVNPYNPGLPTTPHLAELAEKRSLLVERVYTVVPHTSKALVPILCGIEPHLVMEITEAEPNGIPGRCLPELLKEQGYRTVFFQASKEHFESRRGLVTNFGFEHFYPGDTMSSHGFEKVNYFGFEDNIMLESSRRWVRSHRNGPFFAVYLTHTPHHWYGAPRRYGYIEFRAAHSSLYPKERHNDYLNSVRYVDFFIKNVFYQYKRLGVYEDSIFLILGDHGEAFGEHGRNHHDAVPYEEILKVPLIIHDPQRFQNGIRIEGPVSLLDLPASIADLLGYAIDDGQLAGTSMFALPRKRTLMMSCFEERTCLVRLTDFEKYIYHYENQADELFDLSTDPEEQTNLAGGRGEELESWRKELFEWRDGINGMYRSWRATP